MKKIIFIIMLMVCISLVNAIPFYENEVSCYDCKIVTTLVDNEGVNNLTKSGNPVVNVTGKVGNSCQLDGSDYFYNTGTPVMPSNDAWNIHFWVFSTAANEKFFLKYGTHTSTGTTIHFKMDAQHELQISSQATDWNDIMLMPFNTWTHLILSYNDTTQISTLYVNGRKNGTKDWGVGWNWGASNMVVGANTAGSGPMIGQLDSIFIDNGALDDDSCTLSTECGGEIAEIYNSNNGISCSYAGPQPPVITDYNDVSGGGTNNTDDTTPTVNATTDVNADCYTSADNSTWVIMGTTGTTIHEGTLDVGQQLQIGYPQNVSIKCNNSVGSDYAEIQYNITDGIEPGIVLNLPLNDARFVDTINDSFVLNFTATDNHFSTLSCNLTINGAVNQTNSSVANGTLTNWKLTDFSVGAYLWNVTCVDEHLNVNTSVTRNFSIESKVCAVSNVNLYLDGVNDSRKYEFQSVANISANLTKSYVENGAECYDDFTVCIDLDAPGYGKNYTCAVNKTSFNYNITLLRQSSLSDGSNITLLHTSHCYQEFANVSTSCGGLNTGDYSYGFCLGSDFCYRAFDGNWSTYAWGSAAQPITINFNYTIPKLATINSLWQIKGVDGGRMNISLNSNCLIKSNNILELKSVGAGGGFLNWSCYNGSQWLVLLDSGHLIYEEAMVWYFDSVINFTMDNRTDLIEGTINVSGVASGGSLPSNITIKNEAVTVAILPGTLNSTNLTQTEFIHSGSGYTTKNISFASANTEVINVDMSGSGKDFYNLTFQLSGSNVDKGNDVDYNDTFTNESIYHLNANTSVFGYYDNFENNYTDVWEFSISESGGHNNQITTGNVDDYLWVRSTYSSASCSFTTGWSEADNSGDTNFDLRNITQLDYRWRLYTLSGRSSGSGSQTTSSYLYVTDSTNSVSLHGITRTGWSYEVTDNQNISIRKQSDTSWDVYINEVYDSNKVLSSLDPDSQWYLRLRSTSGTAPCTEGDTQNADSDARVYYIKHNGLTLNKTATNVSFENNRSFITSLIVANTSITSNYTSVWFYPVEYKPDGTNIYYYSSADNGTTWLSITPREGNVYLTQGNQIIYRVNLTSNNINKTPILYDLNVKVIPSAITGVEIDGGSDGDVDWNISFELNSTTSPQNVTISSGELLTYSGDYGSQESFLFPISISTGSGGVLQVNNLKAIQNPNPIILNVSVLEDCTFCEISTSMVNGIINITNLAVDLLGSWNYTALAHLPDYSINDSHKVMVKYSKFNCTFPQEIDYFEPFPVMSRDDKNVTPYGQEINYCNTSSDLYCESTSIPIFNCTYLGYDEPLINLTVYLNQSQNGIEIWLNNSLTKTGSVNVTITKKPMIQLNLTHSKGLFGWTDFWNASLTSIYNFDPNISFDAYCSECEH